MLKCFSGKSITAKTGQPGGKGDNEKNPILSRHTSIHRHVTSRPAFSPVAVTGTRMLGRSRERSHAVGQSRPSRGLWGGARSAQVLRVRPTVLARHEKAIKLWGLPGVGCRAATSWVTRLVSVSRPIVSEW